MKHVLISVIAAFGLSACETLPPNALGQVLGGVASQNSGPLSNLEIQSGLRQALEIGATNVSSQLGATDGFFGDERIRIPLPGRLGQLQSTLGNVGLSAPLDDLQLRMNRAAEAAMPEARRLVVSAVQSLSLIHI